MNELALFAGAGGGILGGHLLGWRTVCAVEWEPYAAGVLIARQNDGILPPFPVWDDVRTFDGRAWRGIVDVVSGGFPCQDISCAGKGAGIDGERSGMWVEMARIIGEVGPRFVLVENSPMLTLRGLGRVLSDLVALGYDARWGVLGADDAGAPHVRKRIWIVGWQRDVADDDEGRLARSRVDERQERSGWEAADAGGDGAEVADAYVIHDDRCRSRAGKIRRQWREATELSGSDVADAASIGEREPADEADAFPDGGQAWAESVRGGEYGALFDADEAEGGCKPIWERCGCCDEFVCNLHGCHTNEFECPEIDEWTARGIDPYSDACGDGLEGIKPAGAAEGTTDGPGDGCDRGWWGAEPGVGRVADGVAARVDRLAALGNGQVPSVAALAWRVLAEDFETGRPGDGETR